jgi:hypothetical protein
LARAVTGTCNNSKQEQQQQQQRQRQQQQQQRRHRNHDDPPNAVDIIDLSAALLTPEFVNLQ